MNRITFKSPQQLEARLSFEDGDLNLEMRVGKRKKWQLVFFINREGKGFKLRVSESLRKAGLQVDDMGGLLIH